MPELRNGFLRVAPSTFVNIARIRAVRPFYEDTDVCDPSSALVEVDQGDGYYLAGQTPDDVMAAIHHEPDQQQKAGDRWLTQHDQDTRNAAIHDTLTQARHTITQYLGTAEKWRYDTVQWAFAIMLGEIPEDTPAPDHLNLTPAGRELLTQPRHDDWNADARATYRGMVDDLVSPAHASKRGRP